MLECYNRDFSLDKMGAGSNKSSTFVFFVVPSLVGSHSFTSISLRVFTALRGCVSLQYSDIGADMVPGASERGRQYFCREPHLCLQNGVSLRERPDANHMLPWDL